MRDKPFSKEEIDYIKMMYPSTLTKEIATHLKRKIQSIYRYATKLGLYKTDEFKKSASSGRHLKGVRRNPKNEFQKGHKPWNAGIKGINTGGVQTQFKKGHVPGNTLNDGHISIRVYHRTGIAYKWIRVSKGCWKMLHVHLYEQKFGPVPDGHIVIFKNKDTMDCSLDNLQLISRVEHAANTRNSDGFIAKTLASLGRGKYDKDLAKELINHPELIETKRNQLNLKSHLKNK